MVTLRPRFSRFPPAIARFAAEYRRLSIGVRMLYASRAGHFRDGAAMNRFEISALCTAILITLLAVPNFRMISEIYLAPASTAKWAIWIAGEVVITYGPITVAALCWRWSKRGRLGWLAHLLVLPGAILLLHAGQAILLSVSNFPDFDIAIGAPIMPATFMFLAAFATYCAALLSRLIAASREPAA
ncbi:hypothetical protein J2W22_002065 [Sphingomonas kyeonggiensis]|nr:hypothetical protein [Sphingomonas kyeonggiensis]